MHVSSIVAAVLLASSTVVPAIAHPIQFRSDSSDVTIAQRAALDLATATLLGKLFNNGKRELSLDDLDLYALILKLYSGREKAHGIFSEHFRLPGLVPMGLIDWKPKLLSGRSLPDHLACMSINGCGSPLFPSPSPSLPSYLEDFFPRQAIPFGNMDSVNVALRSFLDSTMDQSFHGDKGEVAKMYATRALSSEEILALSKQFKFLTVFKQKAETRAEEQLYAPAFPLQLADMYARALSPEEALALRKKVGFSRLFV